MPESDVGGGEGDALGVGTQGDGDLESARAGEVEPPTTPYVCGGVTSRRKLPCDCDEISSIAGSVSSLWRRDLFDWGLLVGSFLASALERFIGSV